MRIHIGNTSENTDTKWEKLCDLLYMILLHLLKYFSVLKISSRIGRWFRIGKPLGSEDPVPHQSFFWIRNTSNRSALQAEGRAQLPRSCASSPSVPRGSTWTWPGSWNPRARSPTSAQEPACARHVFLNNFNPGVFTL
jgi:hypothetical protein